MLSALLAAYVCFAPAASPGPTAAAAPAPATPAVTSVVPPERGRLLVRAGGDGTVTVRDPNGRVAASVIVRGGQDLPIDLAPGRYSVTDDSGTTRSIELTGGGTVEVTTAGSTPIPPPTVADATPKPTAAVASEPPRPSPKPAKAAPPSRGPRGPVWKRIVAPLMSATIPGTGQMLNGQPGKGLGMFLGAVSLGAGALAMVLTRDPVGSSAPNLNGTTFGSEVVSGVGFGFLTGGLSMLYAAQIMDAYAVAARTGRPHPRLKHRFSLQLARMATVGFRAGDPAAAFYPDWNFTFLAQVYRRLSVGVSDLSIKYGHARTTAQGGLRITYRFFDRGRLWIGGGLGLIFQGTGARTPRALGDVVSAADRTRAFTAIPYAQLELRLFFLDHWSLDLTPRVSVPFGSRFYRGDLALPSHATTFELGTGVGVVF